jgi:hypothetical protein
MSRATVVAAAVALQLSSAVLFAQQPWSVELRGGATLPTQQLGGADLENGVGIEGTLAYRFMPHTAAYVGWDWLHFLSRQSFAGPDMDFEETGYAFGLKFEHPFRGETTGAAYRLRFGGTYNHIEIEDSSGNLVTDSGHGLGWEIGTGVILPFGSAWRVVPGVRYRSLGRTLTFGGVGTDVDLTYVALEIGFSRHF